uniref:Uncharacterized protein n=1 Tax=Trichinella nativa TaxID=6335 RepID=A0A0V1KJ45_9BILA
MSCLYYDDPSLCYGYVENSNYTSTQLRDTSVTTCIPGTKEAR